MKITKLIPGNHPEVSIDGANITITAYDQQTIINVIQYQESGVVSKTVKYNDILVADIVIPPVKNIITETGEVDPQGQPETEQVRVDNYDEVEIRLYKIEDIFQNPNKKEIL